MTETQTKITRQYLLTVRYVVNHDDEGEIAPSVLDAAFIDAVPELSREIDRTAAVYHDLDVEADIVTDIPNA